MTFEELKVGQEFSRRKGVGCCLCDCLWDCEKIENYKVLAVNKEKRRVKIQRIAYLPLVENGEPVKVVRQIQVKDEKPAWCRLKIIRCLSGNEEFICNDSRDIFIRLKNL